MAAATALVEGICTMPIYGIEQPIDMFLQPKNRGTDFH